MFNIINAAMSSIAFIVLFFPGWYKVVLVQARARSVAVTDALLIFTCTN